MSEIIKSSADVAPATTADALENFQTPQSQGGAGQQYIARMLAADHKPRQQSVVLTKIKAECASVEFATEFATYAIPRKAKGKWTELTGASVHLARALARCWGNLDYSVQVLHSEADQTQVEAMCIDYESNTCARRIVNVKHERLVNKVVQPITNPDHIREYVMAQGSKALRACILQIIPMPITEYALKCCAETVKKRGGDAQQTLSEDKVTKALQRANAVGVTPAMIEQQFNCKPTELTNAQGWELLKLIQAIEQNEQTAEQAFSQHQTPFDVPNKPLEKE